MSANCKGKLLDVHPFAWQASRLWVIRRTIESDSDLVTLERLHNVTATELFEIEFLLSYTRFKVTSILFHSIYLLICGRLYAGSVNLQLFASLDRHGNVTV